MKKRSQVLETVVHGVFLLLGLITVGCVLLISVYLIVSGIPAIREIGIVKFLFGNGIRQSQRLTGTLIFLNVKK